MYRYQKLIAQRATFLETPTTPTTPTNPTDRETPSTIETTTTVPLATAFMQQLIGNLKAQIFEGLKVTHIGSKTPQINSCRSKTNPNISYSIRLAKQGQSLQWDCIAFAIRGQYNTIDPDVQVFEFKAWADRVTPADLIETLENIARTHR